MTVRALARQCPTTDAGATEPTRAAIDEEAADRARGAALARARSSAKAAEAAMERAGDAFNPLLTLLQRQEIGDPAKTVGQVLSAAEAAQFRAHVRTAMDAWITALGALRQTVIDVRAVPKFQPYSGSKGR
jgi:hypothetical protein